MEDATVKLIDLSYEINDDIDRLNRFEKENPGCHQPSRRCELPTPIRDEIYKQQQRAGMM